MKRYDYQATKKYAFKMIQKRLLEVEKSGYWLHQHLPKNVISKGRVYDILNEKESIIFRLDELIAIAEVLDVELRYLIDPMYEKE